MSGPARWGGMQQSYPIFGNGGGTTRAKDAHGTPTQSHISPSTLVFEDKLKCLFQTRQLLLILDYSHGNFLHTLLYPKSRWIIATMNLRLRCAHLIRGPSSKLLMPITPVNVSRALLMLTE